MRLLCATLGSVGTDRRRPTGTFGRRDALPVMAAPGHKAPTLTERAIFYRKRAAKNFRLARTAHEGVRERYWRLAVHYA